MTERFITDLSGRGDLVHRDVYFRKLHSMGASDASTDAYVDINSTKQKVTQIKSTATNGAGQWSVYVRNGVTGNMEASPRVAVTANIATLSADVTRVDGALTVSNYASFENDVDVTTGNMTIGQNLVVDGNTFLGNDLSVSKSGNTTVLSEQALTFNAAWRMVYDAGISGLAFEQNTGTTNSPTWTRRFQFGHT